MHNILVTGGNGQLGSEIKDLEKNYPKYSFYFTDIKELDITNQLSVKIFIEKNNIDIIINCAAYTAVDRAENELELSDKINHLAVRNFAKIAKEQGIKLIQVSTDYVFDGTNYQPYIETNEPNPQSVYGKTKLDGELAMQEINPEDSIIIRTSWVYSSYGNNFVKTMIRLGKERDELGVIFDQVGTPTYAKDLAKAILDIIPQLETKEVEVYHYSNEGVCSWYDFAKAIFELNYISVKVNAIETSEYPTIAKRPLYSVLSKSKIKKQFNVEVPYWKESLTNCLNIL
ncbi:dTDP-4-dehydrorhamnose reductase [Polaribacter sp. SA4-12]|uniref:dTDP-4-dehydrorhamnose reductase n=1 Tax=Polaribacter sp. SA4-12 TaxID=1312072 RepID=UPI000B3D1BD1|nr:dTDP-4-dehydrorhamnose reductase [Polaribacter sp. SA4-12]ARV15115.1 dTDP-4-dehydrorhamnose reductase [Polaribacter sp. SA4-12]